MKEIQGMTNNLRLPPADIFNGNEKLDHSLQLFPAPATSNRSFIDTSPVDGCAQHGAVIRWHGRLPSGQYPQDTSIWTHPAYRSSQIAYSCPQDMSSLMCPAAGGDFCCAQEQCLQVGDCGGKIRSEAHIRRPMNAFMVWSRKRRKEIAAEHQGMHNADLSKILGSEWKAMTHTMKQPYVEQAEAIRVDHMKQYPDYKYRPRRKKKKPADLFASLIQDNAAVAIDELGSQAAVSSCDSSCDLVERHHSPSSVIVSNFCRAPHQQQHLASPNAWRHPQQMANLPEPAAFSQPVLLPNGFIQHTPHIIEKPSGNAAVKIEIINKAAARGGAFSSGLYLPIPTAPVYSSPERKSSWTPSSPCSFSAAHSSCGNPSPFDGSPQSVTVDSPSKELPLPPLATVEFITRQKRILDALHPYAEGTGSAGSVSVDLTEISQMLPEEMDKYLPGTVSSISEMISQSMLV